MRHWLPTFAIDRPVTVLMSFLALLVLGAIAWQRIPLQMMPSGFNPSVIWVNIPFSGASPRETDEQVVRPVEARLGTLSGLEELSSRSSESGARFTVSFYASRDINEAYAEVVDRVERALLDLPDEVDRYWIYKYNPDDTPIVWAGLTLPETLSDPAHLMEQVVRPRLERLPGVASLDVWGVERRSVYVDYDRARVEAGRVSLGEVHLRLSRDNFQGAAGRIHTQGQVRSLRSLARFPDVETLRLLPIGGDRVLADVAEVALRPDDGRSINRINGQQAAAIAVMKESSANTAAVSEAVLGVLSELEADPRLQGARFHVLFNQGALIEDSVDTLGMTALTGGAFALVVLFSFLREWRMTLLIALAIPFSMLITVGTLYFRGDSLNLLSLMGLMLAVGMVVDNAIVVVETIQRKRSEGASPREAAIQGTAEVDLAIVLSTLTTMVVFLPIILMSENATLSFFLKVLGYPVIFALGASLLVALVFAPLATRSLGASEPPQPGFIQRGLTEAYGHTIGWLLSHRVDGLLILALMGALTVALPLSHVGQTDTVEGNLNDFVIRFRVPPQADDAGRDHIVRSFEASIDAHATEWGVRVYRSSLDDGSDHGRIYVYLGEDSALSRDEVMEAAKRALPSDLPGVRARIGWGQRGGSGGGGNAIQITLHGEETATLDALSEEVIRRLETRPGILSASSDYEVSGVNELRLHLRREEAQARGLSAAEVGRTVAMALRGANLNPLVLGDREVPVVARFREADRQDLESLSAFSIQTAAGEVPLRAVTEVSYGKGPSRIYRTDHQTSLTISADLQEDLELDEGMEEVALALEGMQLPRGYSWENGDRFSKVQEDNEALVLALLLSVAFVFLLMGGLFESFLLPLAIITTIPMAGLGAFWGLYLTGTSLDTMGGVGLVILVGVVVNNGIVLIDLVTQLRARGVPRDQALVEAGRQRLRPILMTALTTIFGLVPMAMGTASFIGIPYAPLGRIVISGLATSTVLTLLFVPFLYALLDDLRTGAAAWARFVLWRTP
ncbi:MAG: efflux RND transporter permease subunit [Deltaproteobacteria bacterium]|nr:efflux RND transporter permease subunit [Deltaproteobacteria bacterium]